MEKQAVTCATKGCRSVAYKGKFCNKCKTDRYRKRNPIKASFYILKENAKRRGKPFDLTFDQFKEFVIKTEYIKKKGIFSESYHIDRIDESLGYTIDNIQLLTNSQNVRKYLKYSYDEHVRKMMFTTEVVHPQNSVDGVPF